MKNRSIAILWLLAAPLFIYAGDKTGANHEKVKSAVAQLNVLIKQHQKNRAEGNNNKNSYIFYLEEGEEKVTVRSLNAEDYLIMRTTNNASFSLTNSDLSELEEKLKSFNAPSSLENPNNQLVYVLLTSGIKTFSYLDFEGSDTNKIIENIKENGSATATTEQIQSSIAAVKQIQNDHVAFVGEVASEKELAIGNGFMVGLSMYTVLKPKGSTLKKQTRIMGDTYPYGEYAENALSEITSNVPNFFDAYKELNSIDKALDQSTTRLLEYLKSGKVACEKGDEFLVKYDRGKLSETEYEALKSVAQTICEFPDQDLLGAIASEWDAEFAEMLDQWLLWRSEAARMIELRDDFWRQPNAWQTYYEELNFYLNTYGSLKQKINEGVISNANLTALVNARTTKFLNLYTIDERISIIKNLFPSADEAVIAGSVNWAEIMVTDSEENAILNVLKSVETKSDASLMLEAISDGYIELFNHYFDDRGFGGYNYTNLAREFRRLTKLTNDLNTTEQAKSYVINSSPQMLIWNDDNLFWPKNEDGLVTYDDISLSGDELSLRFRFAENCVTTGGEDNDMGGQTPKTTSCDYSDPKELTTNYFEPVIILVAGNFSSQLPDGISSEAARGEITYAGFLDYLNRKQTSAQIETAIDATVTTASMAFGVGEVYLAIRAGANTGRIAIISWELGNEIIDASMQTQIFKEWCNSNPAECETFRGLHMASQIAGLGVTGVDITNNWDVIKGARVVDGANDFTRGVTKNHFVNSVTDLADNPQIADEAWGLFKNEDWAGLENLFNTNSINKGWPPNFGFINISQTKTGNELNGLYFDRFQKQNELGGGYASPISDNNAAFTIDSRALGVNYDELEDLGQSYYYYKFKINNAPSDVSMQYGDAIPWFGEAGGALQVKTSKGFHEYIDGIEIVEKWVFENGQWRRLE